ncbi:universal stress protein, partial [Nonomuraea sp. MG754425]|uniref:universal stress protein n=1 Tax=Nonomuraea sp. MG754425 TaxID=2570319 RepID=UPI001F195E9F
MAGPIVVGVDGSAPSHAAVEWAALDAGRRRLPLKIVHVCEQWQDNVNGRKYCAGVLEAAVGRVHALDAGIEVDAEMPGGNVVERLIAQAVRADSIVLGSRGVGGFSGLLLGSVTLGV